MKKVKASDEIQAKLRVCARCEWVFKRNKCTDENGCPQCGFAHYGARYSYGDIAYLYVRTQKPWFERKMNEYVYDLIRQRDKALKRDEENGN